MTLRKRIAQTLEGRVNKKYSKEDLNADVDTILKLVGELSDSAKTPEKFKEELIK